MSTPNTILSLGRRKFLVIVNLYDNTDHSENFWYGPPRFAYDLFFLLIYYNHYNSTLKYFFQFF